VDEEIRSWEIDVSFEGPMPKTGRNQDPRGPRRLAVALTERLMGPQPPRWFESRMSWCGQLPPATRPRSRLASRPWGDSMSDSVTSRRRRSWPHKSMRTARS
jgi:hypothetical protein